MCLSLRDILQLALNISFNIALIVHVIRFYEKKLSISNEQRITVLNRNNLNNTKIAFIICLFSAITQLLASAPMLTSSLNLSRDIYSKTAQLSGILNGLKHLSNFFFLLKLNKKFRDALF